MIFQRKKRWRQTENRPQRTNAALGLQTVVMAVFLCLAQCPASASDLVSALEVKTPVVLCGETVPLDDPQVRERFEKEMLLSMGNRPQLILWLKRSTRYFPFIEKSLRQSQLPEDLKFLAVAESALRMHAGSFFF